MREALERGGASDPVARVGARSLVRLGLSHEADSDEDEREVRLQGRLDERDGLWKLGDRCG